MNSHSVSFLPSWFIPLLLIPLYFNRLHLCATFICPAVMVLPLLHPSSCLAVINGKRCGIKFNGVDMCYSDWTQLSVSRTWPMQFCTAPIQFSPNWIILSFSLVNLPHDNLTFPVFVCVWVCVCVHALFSICSDAVWFNEQIMKMRPKL